MRLMKHKRLRQVISYGWKDAGEIVKSEAEVKKSRIAVFADILSCFKRYYVFSNQYKKGKIWGVTGEKRIAKLEAIGLSNRKKDEWIDRHNSDWAFLSKYTSLEWSKNEKKRKARIKAYKEHYGLGDNCAVQYGVTLICEHNSIGKIKCGKNVLFARDVDIDYTGDLIIEDNVKISEGVKILTHNHDLDYTQVDESGHSLIKTPLVIKDNVRIGARSVFLPGVSEIGRRAMIATGAVIKKQIPPYAIVMGNPARVVGFRYTPDQILEFEEDEYPIEERLQEEVLVANYKKYYLDKIQEIKQFLG